MRMDIHSNELNIDIRFPKVHKTQIGGNMKHLQMNESVKVGGEWNYSLDCPFLTRDSRTYSVSSYDPIHIVHITHADIH